MAEEQNNPIDLAWLRGLASQRMNRRDVLRLGGTAASAAGLGALLAACGVSGAGQTKKQSTSVVDAYWAKQKATKKFNFANWPLYIDVGSNPNDHPSIDMFEKKTGIHVKYSEVIQDDGPFFAQVQPSLQNHQYTGYDLAVITNGIYLTDFIDLGYLVPLDHSKLPNFEKYAGSIYKNPSYDPGNTYSVPWQSGMTGIGYNAKLVGREIKSFWELFNPEFKGKVGMFADNEDLPNAVMVAQGKDPTKSTETDWHAAAKMLQKQKSQGIVRQYYTQDYVTALSHGDIWLCQAWSGDIFQANASGASDLKFVVPEQGGLVWTDNMVILKYAENPLAAIEWMNFAYDPKVAAMIAEYVNYVTPVPDAKQVVLADAKAAHGSNRTSLEQVANSPLVFPSQSIYNQLHRYRVLSQKELPIWNSIFEPIYQS